MITAKAAHALADKYRRMGKEAATMWTGGYCNGQADAWAAIAADIEDGERDQEREPVCELCGDTGRVPVLCSDLGHGAMPGLSNEAAARLAGEVDHYEPCPECSDGEDREKGGRQ